jgi:hypothetical protein
LNVRKGKMSEDMNSSFASLCLDEHILEISSPIIAR